MQGRVAENEDRGRYKLANLSSGGVVDPGTFIGPIGKITDKEQFIPLFACVPLNTKQKETGGVPSANFRLTNLSRAYAMSNKKDTVIATRMVSSYLYYLINYDPRYSCIATSELASSSYPIPSGIKLLSTKIYKKNTIKAIDLFIANKEELRIALKNRLKEGFTRASINPEEAFSVYEAYETLPLLSNFGNVYPLYNRIDDAGGLTFNYTLENLWKQHTLIHVNPTGVGRGLYNRANYMPLVTRYNYIAELGFRQSPRLCAIPQELINTMVRSNPQDSFGRPEVSAWYGINTLAVTVVRAKHRSYISSMVMCGMQDKITIPSSDIKFWVAQKAAKKFGLNGETPAKDLEHIRSIFGLDNNQIETEIRDDIDEQLFGNKVSVKNSEEFKEGVLARARTIATTYLKDPGQLLDTIHSL